MIDGRLLVPATAAWLAAAVGLSWLGGSATVTARHDAAVLLVAVAAATASGGVLLTAVSRSRGGGRLLLVGLLLAFAGLGAGATAVRVAAWTPEPVAGWVDDRAVATVRGVLTTEPVRRGGSAAAAWDSAGWQEVRLVTEEISARGRQVAVRLPLLLRLTATTRAPPPGSRVEVTGRLGPRPVRHAATAALAVRSTAAGPWLLVEGPGSLDRAAHAMRQGLRQVLQGTSPEAGSLVAGLAVGDDSGQPPQLAEAMRASGLSHLTAVSGGNVAIVLGIVLVLAGAVRLPMTARVLAALVALGCFVVLVGPEPSVLRAAAMGAVTVVALLAGGRRGGPSILAAAVLVLVLVEPALAGAWGFALSVVATAGLILLAPAVLAPLRRWPTTRRWPPALQHGLALTVAAQVATLPVLVAMGGAAGWVAVPANLAAMPVVAPVTVLGLLAALLSPVLPGVAASVALVASWPAAWIAAVAHACAGLPAAGLPLPGGWAGLAWLLGLAALAAGVRTAWLRLPAGARSRQVRIILAAGALAAVAVLGLLPPDRRGWPPAAWIVIACDVGQGDAVLLRAGPDAAVVVDAGPDPDLVDGCLADADVRSVPLLVLTHFHADHVRGVPGVLRGRSVGQVLATPVREPAEEAESVADTLAEAGLRSTPVTAGDHRVLGGLDLRALWPRRRIAEGSVPNNASIVLLAQVAGRRVLLTGDIEPPAQAAVSADLRGITLDVVKVPHHGSRYQSPLLPVWARAPVALVSVGAGNDYGHPAAETLEAWSRVGAVIGRTDTDGDVAVVDAAGVLGIVRRE